MEILISAFRFIGIVLLVIMMFNIMIVVHEWGHFLAGRWRGLHIDRFQIWFGKPLWKKTINGVQYGLGSIPAGGFVSLPQMAPMEAIEGKVEEGGEEKPKKELPPITPLDKIIVAFAGPLFSFLLAVVFACLVFVVKRPISEAVSSTTIGHVLEKVENAEGEEIESPASKAGLRRGDNITFVDGKKVERFQGMNDSIMWTIISSDNQNIEVDFLRDGKEMSVVVERPAEATHAKVDGPWFKQVWAYLSRRPPIRTIGIYPQVSAIVIETLENSPAAAAGIRKGDHFKAINGQEMVDAKAVSEFEWTAGEEYQILIGRSGKDITVPVIPRVPEVEGTDPKIGIVRWSAKGLEPLERENPIAQVIDSFNAIVKTLKAVFSPKSDVKAGHLSGPFGIMGLYYDLFQDSEGWRKVLWFSVLLNVNLAILNLLPFPVLDGGHIVMATVEWVGKRPIPFKILEAVQTAFVLFLLGFMAFVTLKDVGDRLPSGEAEVSKEPAKKPPAFLPLQTQ